ncbi:hypothetical protein C1S70_17680 [Azospirillum argentinense]|uniref:Uncharacterized protein n=2 Tax=Azospirillum argentinense TaxID=2970906 RepID=A0A2K1FYK5_9PROT|nr:hypothetical protein C1S70_17680 [Azospirillum argentinense]
MRSMDPMKPPTNPPMNATDRQRTLDYFERLGRDKVRLYSAIDCDRYLGGWQVRELADQWLDEKAAEENPVPLWRRIVRRR